MRDFGNLNGYLCRIAMEAKSFLAQHGITDVSIKITALHNGKPINKVGIIGDDDPASDFNKAAEWEASPE